MLDLLLLPGIQVREVTMTNGLLSLYSTTLHCSFLYDPDGEMSTGMSSLERLSVTSTFQPVTSKIPKVVS